jgi:hypothetical protein
MRGAEEKRIIIGGDFNMDKDKVIKEISKRKIKVKRISMIEAEITFRREGIGGEIQQTCIDHVLASDTRDMELRTVDFGQDAGDHSILVCSVGLKVQNKRINEMRKPKTYTLKASDKGAIRKYEKRIRRISAQSIKK